MSLHFLFLMQQRLDFFTFFSWQIKVVVAMRDLFQVVFELKKKEIEDAKTMLENKEQQQQVQKSKVSLKCLKKH